MEENKNLIQRYLQRNSMYSILKIKNTSVYVKDGIITYCVSLNPLSCQCSQQKQLCSHRIFVLNSYLKLDFIVITFIHKLLPKLYENVLSSNIDINKTLTKIVYDEILTDECAICVEKLGGVKTEIAECNVCSKYCHKKCVKKWLDTNKKNNVDKKCVYCNSGEMNIF